MTFHTPNSQTYSLPILVSAAIHLSLILLLTGASYTFHPPNKKNTQTALARPSTPKQLDPQREKQLRNSIKQELEKAIPQDIPLQQKEKIAKALDESIDEEFQQYKQEPNQPDSDFKEQFEIKKEITETWQHKLATLEAEQQLETKLEEIEKDQLPKLAAELTKKIQNELIPNLSRPIEQQLDNSKKEILEPILKSAQSLENRQNSLVETIEQAKKENEKNNVQKARDLLDKAFETNKTIQEETKALRESIAQSSLQNSSEAEKLNSDTTPESTPDLIRAIKDKLNSDQPKDASSQIESLARQQKQLKEKIQNLRKHTENSLKDKRPDILQQAEAHAIANKLADQINQLAEKEFVDQLTKTRLPQLNTSQKAEELLKERLRDAAEDTLAQHLKQASRETIEQAQSASKEISGDLDQLQTLLQDLQIKQKQEQAKLPFDLSTPTPRDPITGTTIPGLTNDELLKESWYKELQDQTTSLIKEIAELKAQQTGQDRIRQLETQLLALKKAREQGLLDRIQAMQEILIQQKQTEIAPTILSEIDAQLIPDIQNQILESLNESLNQSLPNNTEEWESLIQTALEQTTPLSQTAQAHIQAEKSLHEINTARLAELTEKLQNQSDRLESNLDNQLLLANRKDQTVQPPEWEALQNDLRALQEEIRMTLAEAGIHSAGSQNQIRESIKAIHAPELNTAFESIRIFPNNKQENLEPQLAETRDATRKALEHLIATIRSLTSEPSSQENRSSHPSTSPSLPPMLAELRAQLIEAVEKLEKWKANQQPLQEAIEKQDWKRAETIINEQIKEEESRAQRIEQASNRAQSSHPNLPDQTNLKQAAENHKQQIQSLREIQAAVSEKNKDQAKAKLAQHNSTLKNLAETHYQTIQKLQHTPPQQPTAPIIDQSLNTIHALAEARVRDSLKKQIQDQLPDKLSQSIQATKEKTETSLAKLADTKPIEQRLQTIAQGEKETIASATKLLTEKWKAPNRSTHAKLPSLTQDQLDKKADDLMKDIEPKIRNLVKDTFSQKQSPKNSNQEAQSIQLVANNLENIKKEMAEERSQSIAKETNADASDQENFEVSSRGDTNSNFRPGATLPAGNFNPSAFKKLMREVQTRVIPSATAIAPAQPSSEPTQLVENHHPPTPAILHRPEPQTPKTTPDQPSETLPPPAFPHIAYGAASYTEESPVIDGDFTDWGEMIHPLTVRYEHNGDQIKNGPQIFLKWNASGLYIAYEVRDQSITPNKNDAWSGDCMEIFIDMQNSRKSLMNQSASSHQFTLMPFGYKGDSRTTFSEIGRGFRGRAKFETYPDSTGSEGKSAAQTTPDGYRVEGFISTQTLSGKKLEPGMLLGMNFSINTGEGWKNHRQWAAPKSAGSWDKPDTWGDVILLGRKAELRFTQPTQPTETLQQIDPYQPIGLSIHDQDANINLNAPDSITALLRTKGTNTTPFTVTLRETEPNSSTFTAQVSTQPYYAGDHEKALRITPASHIEFVYNDSGNPDQPGTAQSIIEIPVSTPIFKLKPKP